jgi:hypothetical protein
MRLKLNIVANTKAEILEALQELVQDFSKSRVDSNCRTCHPNQATSDYSFTEGTEIDADDAHEKVIRP